MGGWKGDEDGEARNMGPWYTHRAPVSQQIGKVNTKKVQCGVCEVRPYPSSPSGWFRVRSSATTVWSLLSASHSSLSHQPFNRFSMWALHLCGCAVW
jgi:hypothetical protein